MMGCGPGCGCAPCQRDYGMAGLTDWVGNFALGFTGQRPVFNSAGVKIGYWTGVGDLCAGTIHVENTAAATGGPETWTTKDDLWRDVPVPEFCKAAGYNPPWAANAASVPGEAILQNVGRTLDNTVNTAGGVTQGTANATGVVSVLTGGAANLLSNPTIVLAGGALLLFLLMHKRTA